MMRKITLTMKIEFDLNRAVEWQFHPAVSDKRSNFWRSTSHRDTELSFMLEMAPRRIYSENSDERIVSSGCFSLQATAINLGNGTVGEGRWGQHVCVSLHMRDLDCEFPSFQNTDSPQIFLENFCFFWGQFWPILSNMSHILWPVQSSACEIIFLPKMLSIAVYLCNMFQY